MPSPEERERPEASGGSSSTSLPDTLALQTLMDVQRFLGRLETSVEGCERSIAQNTNDLNKLGERHTKELNQLGQRLSKEISDLKTEDIGKLNNVAHTADKLFRIFLGALAVILTVLGPPLMIYLYHHMKLVFQP